jgi:hypothetical protein
VDRNPPPLPSNIYGREGRRDYSGVNYGGVNYGEVNYGGVNYGGMEYDGVNYSQGFQPPGFQWTQTPYGYNSDPNYAKWVQGMFW